MCRRFLLGAALLLFLSGDRGAEAGLLGSSKCTWGPSYWCSGLPQSAKCTATQHCIERVWGPNPFPADDDEVCTICKKMVKEARDQLESNETQTEIKQVFEGSCKLIPLKVVADECIKLSDEFIVELIEMLASEMDPDTVCTVSGLCNSGKIDHMLKEWRESFRTDCDVCHEETQKMSLKVRLMSKDDVLDKGLEMCGQLSSYSDACRMLLLDNFDIVYETLTHLDFVCGSSAICSESYKNVRTTLGLKEGGDDLECEFCEKVIQHWIDEWKSNSTMEEFKEVLEAFCHKLGQPDRIKRCSHIVDDYYIPVFKYILNTLNAHEACAAAGLCGSKEFMEIDSTVPISVTLPRDAPLEQRLLLGSEAPAEVPETPRLIGGYFAPQTVVAMKTPGCVMCEFVLYRLREWLQDEHTKDEVEKGLSEICSSMPSSLRDQCDEFVGTYGPAIIQMIIEGADASKVCTLLQLCEPKEVPHRFELLSQTDNPIAQMKKKDEGCATCQYVMAIVMETISSKDNRDEVRNVLDSVCTLMPSSVADRCESFVNSYAEEVMQMIADNLTPDQICEGLSMCERRRPRDQKCVICEYVINTLDSILEDKRNEEEIKKALENVCGYLPKTVSKECIDFVDTYTQAIIDLLAHGTTPEEVCTGLGLCHGDDSSSSEEDDSSSEEDDSSSEEYSDEEGEEEREERPYCMLCEYAIGEVDHLVEDKQNQEQVKETLDVICSHLSQPITKECIQMVNRYTDEIVEMFAKDFTPEKVCAALRLCDKKISPEPEMSNDIALDLMRSEGGQLEVGGGDDTSLCSVCEFGVGVVETRILNNRNLDVVKHAVLMMCSYLPGTVADKCEEVVERYGEQIIHLIVDSEMSPKEVCSELRLCPKTTDMWDASSVGGHRCEWGPAFWCKSAFHANACGTMEYCLRSGKFRF